MIEGVKEVGVVGAGTMGAGVAQTFAAAGYPVRLRDIGEAPLTRGMSAIEESLERQVGRGNLKPEDGTRRSPASPPQLRSTTSPRATLSWRRCSSVSTSRRR